MEPQTNDVLASGTQSCCHGLQYVSHPISTCFSALPHGKILNLEGIMSVISRTSGCLSFWHPVMLPVLAQSSLLSSYIYPGTLTPGSCSSFLGDCIVFPVVNQPAGYVKRLCSLTGCKSAQLTI